MLLLTCLPTANAANEPKKEEVIYAALKLNGQAEEAYQALVTLRETLDDLMDFYNGIIDYTEGVQEAATGVSNARGYAVADFRKVRPDLGTMEDLEALTEACHEKGMNVCMDFVMNHTSEDHEWAKRARSGEGEYMSRYFFYADPSVPNMYEKTVPQVFPTTAPGNFTWLPECRHWVMTTFYPYQWDLN